MIVWGRTKNLPDTVLRHDDTDDYGDVDYDVDDDYEYDHDSLAKLRPPNKKRRTRILYPAIKYAYYSHFMSKIKYAHCT